MRARPTAIGLAATFLLSIAVLAPQASFNDQIVTRLGLTLSIVERGLLLFASASLAVMAARVSMFAPEHLERPLRDFLLPRLGSGEAAATCALLVACWIGILLVLMPRPCLLARRGQGIEPLRGLPGGSARRRGETAC